MELPKYTFVNKDAGLIEDWVRQRIKDLLLSKRFQDADALYREFDVCETSAQSSMPKSGKRSPAEDRGAELISAAERVFAGFKCKKTYF